MAHQVGDVEALFAGHEQQQRQMRRPDNPGGAGKNPPFSGAVQALLLLLLMSDLEGKLAGWSGNPAAFKQQTAGVQEPASLEKLVPETCTGAGSSSDSSGSSSWSESDDVDDGVDEPEWAGEGDDSSSSSSGECGRVVDTFEAALFAFKVAVSPEARQLRQDIAAAADAVELQSLLHGFGETLLDLTRQGACKAGARTGYVEPYLFLRWLSRQFYSSKGGVLWVCFRSVCCRQEIDRATADKQGVRKQGLVLPFPNVVAAAVLPLPPQESAAVEGLAGQWGRGASIPCQAGCSADDGEFGAGFGAGCPDHE
jgi:hypothetical protein